MERDLPFGSLTFLYLMFLLVRATFPDSDPILNGRVIHVFLSQVGEAKKILFDMFALNLIHISIQLCTFETTSPPLQAKRKHGVPHMRLLTFLLHAIGLCCSDARPRPQFRVQYMSFYFTRVRFLNIISLGTDPI